MAIHPGISSFICSVHNPAHVSPCASRTDKGRLFGDLFVPLMYGERGCLGGFVCAPDAC